MFTVGSAPVEDAELALDLVPVLVGDDVGDREVADRAAEALRAAGQRAVQVAGVDAVGEPLRDRDRVVAGQYAAVLSSSSPQALEAVSPGAIDAEADPRLGSPLSLNTFVQ